MLDADGRRGRNLTDGSDFIALVPSVAFHSIETTEKARNEEW